MRRTLLLLTTMTLALLMASSVALALDRISCQGGYCPGTTSDDVMSGTAVYDEMVGDGGNDKLNGYGANDTLRGGLGNDTLNGGAGNDTLEDDSGTNTLNGGADEDVIWANGGGDERAKVSGGSENDLVYALDNARDTINCGTGTLDQVYNHDPGLDVVRGCEIIRPL
jgi:Ca2+-binding RTX toxin-like protein